MEGIPGWFGPPGRRSFGVLHEPPDEARAVVVICPPLGYEAVCAHSALRRLAEALASRGIASLRVEYAGTGNGLGDPTPDDAARYVDAITDAVDLTSTWGACPVMLLGLRIGGTLAGLAASRREDRVSGLVLWDPVASGRHYIRRLRLLHATGGGGDDGRGLVIGGVRFEAGTVAGLAALRLPAPPPLVETLLVEPAETPSIGLDGWATAPRVTRDVLPGTVALLDADAELSVIPQAILTRIADWVDAQTPSRHFPLRHNGLDYTTSEKDEGATLVHRATRIGPDGLFAVVTTPVSPAPSWPPPRGAVVMVNNGVAPQIGPGRAWVEWSRRLGALGLITVRADISGLGDSGHPQRMTPESYPATAGRDLHALVEHVHGLGTDRVALLGLCSGALLAFDGLKAGADVDAVIAINPRFDRAWVDPRRDRHVRAAGPTNRLLAVPLRKTPLFGLFERVPTTVWSLLDRLHLVASPSVALRQVHGSDSRLLLIFGPRELGLRALRRRASDFDALLADPGISMVEVPGLDHSMFDPSARANTFEVVRSYLENLWGLPIR